MTNGLVAFAGPPCAGKSTVGRMIPNAVHLEMDVFRIRILPDAMHTRADRMVAYRAMHYAAELLLPHCSLVIVNGGYGHYEDRQAVCQTAGRRCLPLYAVEFHLPLDVALQRNRDRRGHHPGRDLDDRRVTQLIAGFRPSPAALQVDGTWPPERIVQAILAWDQPVFANRWADSLRSSESEL